MLQNNAINKFQENSTAEVAQEVNVNVANEVTSDESINAVEGAALNLKKMKNTIYTVAELAEMGKTIARLEANRDFNTKAVNDKKKSLLDKGQLVPAIMVEATDAIKAGLSVVEFDTNEEIKLEEADQYVVLLDGNHRYKAHKKLLESKKGEYQKDFYVMYTLQPEVAIAQSLAEINISTTPWKGADYVKGVLLMLNEEASLPVLEAIGSLTSKGYSLDAASKWILMEQSGVTKSMLVKAVSGKTDESWKSESNAKLGMRFWEAASKAGFKDSFLAKRTFVGCLLNKWDKNNMSKNQFVELMERFFESVDEECVNKIQGAKGTRGESKEGVINAELNPYWDKFMKKAEDNNRIAIPAAQINTFVSKVRAIHFCGQPFFVIFAHIVHPIMK